MNEIWKDIVGYEGLYQVSSLGRVKSLDRIIIRKNGSRQRVSERVLKAKKNKGYLQVTLSKNKISKNCRIHRVVLQTFKPVLNMHKLDVNHKDENTLNNNVNNLEWCTRKYNINYGTHNERMKEALSKPVCQYTKDGELIKEWNSTSECGKNGFNQSAVARCCRGEQKTHKGFLWKYKKVAK